jgi:hypothetical protein
MPAGRSSSLESAERSTRSHQEQPGVQAMVVGRAPWSELNAVMGAAHRCVTAITGSRTTKGGQSVGEFGVAELGFEFADAIHGIALEVPDDGRSRGVGRFEPGERAPKMPKLVKSGSRAGGWWLLGWHRCQRESFHGIAKCVVTPVIRGSEYRQACARRLRSSEPWRCEARECA